jgi:Phage integrase family
MGLQAADPSPLAEFAERHLKDTSRRLAMLTLSRASLRVSNRYRLDRQVAACLCSTPVADVYRALADETRRAWGAPKTPESARTIDLPEVVIRPLVEHLLRFPPLRGREDPRLEGLVFYGERCGPVGRHVFLPVWDRACKSAGLEGIRPEWLRHTGASLAYAATRDMKAVAERLGHTSTRMMDTVYVEVYANT